MPKKEYRPHMSWGNDLLDIVTKLDAFYDRLQDGYGDFSRNKEHDRVLLNCIQQTEKAFNILISVVEELNKMEEIKKYTFS